MTDFAPSSGIWPQTTVAFWSFESSTAFRTTTSPRYSRCHAMSWWTVYVAYEPTCGEKRKFWAFDGRPVGRRSWEDGGRRNCNSPGKQVGRAASRPGDTNQPCGASARKGPARDAVLSLSYPEGQKLCFQGRGHFAALRGPSSPGGRQSSWPGFRAAEGGCPGSPHFQLVPVLAANQGYGTTESNSRTSRQDRH